MALEEEKKIPELEQGVGERRAVSLSRYILNITDPNLKSGTFHSELQLMSGIFYLCGNVFACVRESERRQKKRRNRGRASGKRERER